MFEPFHLGGNCQFHHKTVTVSFFLGFVGSGWWRQTGCWFESSYWGAKYQCGSKCFSSLCSIFDITWVLFLTFWPSFIWVMITLCYREKILLCKLIWKRNRRQTVKPTPEVSVLNIHHNLQTNFWFTTDPLYLP